MRDPLAAAEANNFLGEGLLTDSEIEEFIAVVDQLRLDLPAAFDRQWNDPVSFGEGYVITASRNAATGTLISYHGVRKTSKGYALISGDERGYEGIRATFSRFEDAVKGYAAEIISAIRWTENLGPVAWMWNGGVGGGVGVQSLNPPYDTEFRFFLEDDPKVWIEGRKIDATLTQGFSMQISEFIAAILTHPRVTAKDTTAWNK
ncbi:hypothetical protein ACT89R_31205 (plasmid) [Rhodococcus qingshengii]